MHFPMPLYKQTEHLRGGICAMTLYKMLNIIHDACNSFLAFMQHCNKLRFIVYFILKTDIYVFLFFFAVTWTKKTVESKHLKYKVC